MKMGINMKRIFTAVLIALLSCTIACAQGSGSKRPRHGGRSGHVGKGKKGASNGKSKYTPEILRFVVEGVSFDMVEVRGGTFRMGATSEQGEGATSDAKPVHSVTLSGYFIGKTEVTQALWQAVMGSNPSEFTGDELPVECVSWNDCQEFIRKLNALTGQNFRLPTEAEW